MFFDPPEALAEMRAWLPGVRLLAQAGGDLGARMSDAFARAFARGAGGWPSSERTSRRLAGDGGEALAALDAADVVIGPAEDGGYYLIALREPRPELFAGIAWSTPASRGRRGRGPPRRALGAGAAGLRDVDTLEDLRAAWPVVRALLADRPELCDALRRHVGLLG